MTSSAPLIAASILTADFGHLDRVVRKLERAGIDRLHLDVMDGHFVPSITFGADIVAAFRRLTALPLDVHLMIADPSRKVASFLDAGPQSVTFHVEVAETDETKDRTLEAIRSAGVAAGLAISPSTPVEAVEPFLARLDVVMVMTVVPGAGGQRFLVEEAPKMAVASRWLIAAGAGGQVHVDGGVNRDTATAAGRWGADVCVVGSALFQRGQDAADEVRLVRERARQARRDADQVLADASGSSAGAPAALAGGRTSR